MKLENMRYAKDLFVQLPGTLIVKKDELDCLIRLGEYGIKKIIQESEKKDPLRPLFLSTSYKVVGSPEPARDFDYTLSFDWDKVVDIKISGDTMDYLKNKDSEPIQYISILFTMMS